MLVYYSQPAITIGYQDRELCKHDSKFRGRVKLPRAEKRRPSPLEKMDVVKIINECKEPRLKIYVHFLTASGCRAEEALSLRLGDIDNKRGIIKLHAEFTKTQ
jgi:integrase